MTPKKDDNPPRPFQEDYQEVEPILFREDGPGMIARPDPCSVPVESPLTIEVKEVGAFTVMSSPGEALALAVGFLLGEGLISSLDDIGFLRRCEDDPSVIRIQLTAPPAGERPARNLIVASSCGLCGAQNLDEMIAELPQVGRTLTLAPEALMRAVRTMEETQVLYGQTGGTHAAAIFDQAGRILSQAEDMGRHNALDKAVGKMILAGQKTAGLAVALSGRVSLEMIVKSARAGLELIAAVSSPTSLALEAAKRCGISVCGFVRETRATSYTHSERIAGLREMVEE